MKRLIIVCEGLTEQAFCNDLLYDYLQPRGISIFAPTVKHSNGGIVAWDTLKKQILMHLNEGDCIVSLLIDYYRIKDSYKFPGWKESKNISNIYDRMRFLFQQMSLNIGKEFQSRFIPYIQLHEFEGLLFSDISVFPKIFPKEVLNLQLLTDAVNSFNTPEEINNSPSTAPSERLKKAVCGYDKVTDGDFLALEIGLNKIREKCILFNEWIEKLETL